ncbi:MAG TPA: hypothetical protein VFR84_17170 [Candidatus Angelobacter sp.]|nr:hypothetical protein [Candidatus Angelobacter sp.]
MFWFALILLVSAIQAKDTSSPMSARSLKPAHAAELPVPAFGAYGNPACDENLALYYHLATDRYSRTVLLRFSQSGTESTLYRLPDEFAESTDFVDFSVTPAGDVKALVIDQDFHPMIFGFDSEGKANSHARLETPEYVTATHISVFPNGTAFLSGYYRSDAPADLIGKAYIGIFHPSGKLLKQLNRLGEKGKVDPPAAGRFAEGATTVGRDGNVYLLTASKVLVISSSGTLKREIPFTKPGPEFSAVRVQYSDGWLAISFAKPEKPAILYQYLVVNASDGSALGLYEPTEETGNSNDCFSRHDGFLFTTVEHDRVKLITAPLR